MLLRRAEPRISFGRAAEDKLAPSAAFLEKGPRMLAPPDQLTLNLRPDFSERSIDHLLLSFRNRQINLTPGFQRKSVWTVSDRRRLIQSIFDGYPVPSIFLYRRHHKGKLIYDVIDGKQRLESILMFLGQGRFKSDRFETTLDLGDGLDWYSWKEIKRWHPKHVAALNAYKIQTVEIDGQLPQIIDLFVRINSTGKSLTSGEKRHARFYNKGFLKAAERLANQFHRYLRDQRILSAAQIDRMKGVELLCEMLMSVQTGGPINKKTSLDRAIGNDSINGNTLHHLVAEVARTLRLLRRMFPSLRETRLRNSAEFYSLFLLVWEMNQNKFILTDIKRNRIAFALLTKLSTEVDKLREQLRKARPGRVQQRLYQEYLLTVQGDTDSAANRQRRGTLLKELLWSIFDRKDDKRLFTTRSAGNFVIDLFDLSEVSVRQDYPKIYQYVLETVFPHRRTNNRKSYRDRWWQFAEPRRTFRPALTGLRRYVATTETSKHRLFQFVPQGTIPDHMVIAIASDDSFVLGVLSGRIHVLWAMRVGGWLGVGNDPRYTKSLCFDTFPFRIPLTL